MLGSDSVKDIGHGRIFDRQQGGESRVAVPGAKPVEQAGDSLLRAALRQHGIVTRRGFRGLHITCDGAVPPVGGSLPRGADQRRLDRGRVGLIGSVEQFGADPHVLRLGDEGSAPYAAARTSASEEPSSANTRSAAADMRRAAAALSAGTSAAASSFASSRPTSGLICPLNARRAFIAAPASRAFERPGQSLKRLPAADTARGGNCGLGHAVVGRRYGGRNHIGLRHGAALPEPSG